MAAPRSTLFPYTTLFRSAVVWCPMRTTCDRFREKRITVELTRRRESKHPPPHRVSCETRSRRSRPTICYAAPKCDAPTIQHRAERATTFAHLQPPVILVARDGGHFDERPKGQPVCRVFKSGDGITVELTRRKTTTLRTSCR